jgi:hypothetical protein
MESDNLVLLCEESKAEMPELTVGQKLSRLVNGEVSLPVKAANAL